MIKNVALIGFGMIPRRGRVDVRIMLMARIARHPTWTRQRTESRSAKFGLNVRVCTAILMGLPLPLRKRSLEGKVAAVTARSARPP